MAECRELGAAGNREVSGYTRMVNDARREARRVLDNAVRDQGGQGAVVQEMTQRFSDRECPSTMERSDCMVEATILWSAIVSFEQSVPTTRQAPLAITRLDRGPTAKTEPRPEPSVTEAPSLGHRAAAYWAARRDEPKAGGGN